jgi:hypothetical protein
VFCAGSATWDQALTACSDAGMQLVRVNDGPENGWLRSTATLRALGSVWIGASDLSVEGEWRWTDGVQFWQGTFGINGMPTGGLYSSWSMPQPDNAGSGEHCAEMTVDSLWNDQSCAQPSGFVCQPP